ncbi:MurR/RpiR family transcriptional regulator [Brevibacterium moorei]|uniref:MurR/RpiR family transcriptional regulator n=1 Tax=Brevibacterium moorei TaxID=2968457 RepID=UPI00211CF314|nr:MurR/RpiR family transcriptional regulator [Brevibacterium sp. 68QC2CO]MCQ9386832.1 MurR/RpiR family transcriptional regulator [Brevibacterium sp. 68QC2CO]
MQAQSDSGDNGATGFSTRVARAVEHLTPNQLKVVRYFEHNATLTLTSSADDIAKALGLSTASVIRAAQALGYEGLTALKRDLAREITAKGVSPGQVLDRRLSTGPVGHERLQNILADMGDLVLETGSTIDVGCWDQAVSALLNARRTFAYGVEESGHVAETFVHHMRTFGFDAVSCTRTGIALAPYMALAEHASCIVIFSPLRVFPEIRELLSLADDKGIPTIVITEIVNAEFVNESSIVLQTPSSVMTSGSNTIAPTALSFALTQQLASEARAESTAAYNRMLQFRERI